MSKQTVEVIVKVVPTVPVEGLHKYDKKLPPEVPVSIHKGVQYDWIANAALDVFHSQVAVKCPEDFEFEVWKDGVCLNPKDTNDSYTLSEEGEIA